MEKKSILHDLYYGAAEPYVDFQTKEEKHRLLREKHRERYYGFMKKLNEVDGQLEKEFQKLYDDLFLEIPYETEEAFEIGFCTGVRVMMEVMKRG